MNPPEGWTITDNALQRVFNGPDYLTSLRLLNEIGQMAEVEDHHPDLLLYYKKLIVRFWTHTANGITPLDHEMAGKVEALIKSGYTAHSA